jgi:type IV secretion system protein VirB6
MACPPIITGDQFLVRTLSHIDCQAQLVGSYGYQALGAPGSVASTLMLGLLTLFIAFFGIRLMFGPPVASRDVVFDVIRIGLVLTLAFSWPTFRTLVYDVTLKGPAEIASVIQSGSGNGQAADFASRLQQTDNAIAELTRVGAGRNTAAILDQSAPGGTFAASALEDDQAFGSARLLYLSGIIGTLALLRIGAGLLLALTPVIAGLYFFPQTRGIFAGWLKGLVFTLAGSIGTTMVLSVELALLQPWLRDALQLRSLGYAAPSAPIELFAITLAFTLALLLMLWLLAKVTFHRGWLTLPDIPWPEANRAQTVQAPAPAQTAIAMQVMRYERLSNAITRSTTREMSRTSQRLVSSNSGADTASAGSRPEAAAGPPRLGSSYRRAVNRPSRAALNRDRIR